MANLRTNNLCGEGGRNAYNGSVYFGSRYTFLQLDGSSDFAFGTGDFTIEAWIKIDNETNTNAIYDSRPSGSNGAQVALFYSASSNAILFAHGGTVRITGTTDVGADHAWHHVALTRASGSTKLFVNGIQEGSTYSDSTSYENPADRPLIGQSGGSTNLAADTFFKGYISNLRVCAGHAVYTANFTPPTSPLTVHYNSDGDETVLLCCQNSDDPTQEATGKTIVANGLTSLVNRTDNLIKNGRFTASATENWTLSGGTAVLGTGQSGTFNDGNHLVLTASSSYAYLKQSFTTVVGRTYRVNAQSNGGDQSYISTSTSESDAVITDIRSSTQTTDGRAAEKNFIATQTTYHVILRATTGGGNFDTVSVYEEENRVPPKVLPPFGTDAGNTFGGGISMNSLDYMYFPTGRTEERARGRAVIMGGTTHTPSPNSYMTRIDFITIPTMGNSQFFGDLSFGSRDAAGAVSSTIRAVYAGGMGPSSEVATNSMDFVTIATQGNGTDYGDLTAAKRQAEGCSNGIRGLFMGGENDSPSANTYNNVIDFCTIASLGDASDFGDLTAARDGGGVCSSPTRGVMGGGYDSGNSEVIDFVTIASTGDATDFGNLTAARTQATGCASATRGLFMGGRIAPNNKAEIDFITIASTGDASDFGDLSEGKNQASATASQTRGVHIGGNNGSSPYNLNTMEFVTIASTGNSTDFGDTNQSRTRATTSDCHGGLS